MRSVYAVTWVAVSLLGVLAPGCSDEEGARGGLAAACKLNSDCAVGLICSSNTCHVVCVNARDCPSGALCVTVAEGKVCEASDAGTSAGGSVGAGGVAGTGGIQVKPATGGADTSVGDAAEGGGAPGLGGAQSSGGSGPGGATSSGGANPDSGAGGTVSTGGVSGTGGASPDSGAGGAMGSTPGCAGIAATCGHDGNADCCASSVLPAGTFNRSGYAPATLSSFRLDTYEVTVGRFRKFAAAYSQNLTVSGTGKNPNDSGDPGWDAGWNASLPADAAALKSAVKCSATYQTWTDTAGSNENRPVNCVTWYEAFAFCIWDGGRLPTEAEWNYAATGGNEQRQYPWSNPSGTTTLDCTYANYGGANPTATACVIPGTGAANDVGSESPKGDGLWGQADLAGNVWEWTIDWYGVPYPSTCTNCAQRTGGSFRVNRGGSFLGDANGLLSSDRNYAGPTDRPFTGGFRCARSP